MNYRLCYGAGKVVGFIKLATIGVVVVALLKNYGIYVITVVVAESTSPSPHVPVNVSATIPWTINPVSATVS